MEKFDSKLGLVADANEAVRNVSVDLVNAEKIIRELKTPMFVEDLIKLVQSTCSLTNDEVYGLILKVDAELKPKEEEPIIEE